MIEIIVPFEAQVKGGGVITVRAAIPGQALYWALVGLDPISRQEKAPSGSLARDHTRADNSGFSTNIYIAPIDPEAMGSLDQVKVTAANA